MKYENIKKTTFISRPNRFVAYVNYENKETKIHVKNTGRCKELLQPDSIVYMEDFENRMGTRKNRFSLIAVEKQNQQGKLLINMDSQVPNIVVEEALKNGTIKLPNLEELIEIKREKTYKDSRFDFYLKDKNQKEAYLEVKGVTLENNQIASFPDAPTERGIKHIEHLISAKYEGFESYIVFVIQMKPIMEFQPNYKTHAAFGETLKKAQNAGVTILAYDCIVTPDSLNIDLNIPIKL